IMALENDEIRRTNVERKSKHECANNSDHGAAFAFVIRFRNSFVIGNSSFVIHNGAPPSDRLSDQSFFTWMLPPLLRRTMGFPPPLTGPLRWSRAILPLTVTGKSLVTPPPDVAASRSNAESCARCTVTPPPDVPSFTSSDNGVENQAEMEPPEVEPSTLPATFSRVMPPPVLSTRIGPRNSFTVTEPPEVSPDNVPEPPDTSMPPPLVRTLSVPSQYATRMPPPDVAPSSGPCRRVNFSP